MTQFICYNISICSLIHFFHQLSSSCTFGQLLCILLLYLSTNLLGIMSGSLHFWYDICASHDMCVLIASPYAFGQWSLSLRDKTMEMFGRDGRINPSTSLKWKNVSVALSLSFVSKQIICRVCGNCRLIQLVLLRSF